MPPRGRDGPAGSATRGVTPATGAITAGIRADQHRRIGRTRCPPDRPGCRRTTRTGSSHAPPVSENPVIILGIILIVVGYLAPVPSIIATIGWILLVVGLILTLLGAVGRPVGRKTYF